MVKITELTELASNDADDFLLVVDTSVLQTKKLQPGNLVITSSQISDFDSYVDQDVTTGSSPTFDGANITGVSAENVPVTTISNSDTNADYYCDGTDDYVQIQAAIDAINTNGGGLLMFDNTGDAYVKGTTDIIVKSNVWIDGNGAEFTNGTSGSLFENTTTVLDNVMIRNIRVGSTTSTSYIFNFTEKNTNMNFFNLYFEETAGRAFYCGGSFNIDGFTCDNSWSGIGTPSYAADDTALPYITIKNANIVNVDKTTGTEGEGIEINAHQYGTCLIDNVIIKGMQEEGADLNIQHLLVNNLKVEMDPSVDGARAVTVNTSELNVRGALNNVIVTGVDDGALSGIYVNHVEGFSLNNCSVFGTNAVTPEGTGFNITGGSSTAVTMNNCYAQDLEYAVESDVNELLTGFNFRYSNCTNEFDGAQPLAWLGQNSFSSIQDSSDTYWQNFRVGNLGNYPVYFSRNTQDTQEFLSISMNDNDLTFTYNQDETSGTHDIFWNLDTGTGNTSDSSFMYQREGNDIGGFMYDATITNTAALRIGAYYLWVDSTGDLRIKSSAPTSDTDGDVVGSQS